jgi:hypothetical protein
MLFVLDLKLAKQSEILLATVLIILYCDNFIREKCLKRGGVEQEEEVMVVERMQLLEMLELEQGEEEELRRKILRYTLNCCLEVSLYRNILKSTTLLLVK